MTQSFKEVDLSGVEAAIAELQTTGQLITPGNGFGATDRGILSKRHILTSGGINYYEVTLQGKFGWTHASASTVLSTAGIIPTEYRPTTTHTEVFRLNQSTDVIRIIEISTNGTISVFYRSMVDGSAVNDTDTENHVHAHWLREEVDV